MKKLLLSLVLVVSVIANLQAGLIVTNIASAGTNLIWAGRQQVYQVSVLAASNSFVRLYDTRFVGLMWTNAAYIGSSNIASKVVTNLQTNAIFVYSGSTQYLIQTNMTLAGAYTTNFTVAASETNNVPLAAAIYAPAGTITTLDAVDMNFINGITVANTNNNVTYMIYTRD